MGSEAQDAPIPRLCPQNQLRAGGGGPRLRLWLCLQALAGLFPPWASLAHRSRSESDQPGSSQPPIPLPSLYELDVLKCHQQSGPRTFIYNVSVPSTGLCFRPLVTRQCRQTHLLLFGDHTTPQSLAVPYLMGAIALLMATSVVASRSG